MNKLMTDDYRSDSGWITFQTLRTLDGRVLLVQKRDGCTRTIPAAQSTWRS